MQIHSKQQFLVNSDITFGGAYKITNALNATNPQDYVTLSQLQAVQQGLDVKDSVRVATTANIALTGTQTIDGIALSAGNRVLVKNQTIGSENGIYVVSAGAWVRSIDADTSVEVTGGMFTFTEEGTVNADSGFILTTNNPIVLGTTALTFAQFSGAGSYAAGSGLTLTGSTFSVNTDNTTIGIIGNNVTVRSTATQFQTLISSGTAGAAAVWGAINLASGAAVSGVLPIANGGTNSSAALIGNRIMISSGTAIIEAPALTNGQILVGSTGAAPVATTITGSTNVVVTNTTGAITLSTTGLYGAANFVENEVPAGIVDGTNASFTLAATPITNSQVVFVNGLKQKATVDFNITGATITFTAGNIPQSGQYIEVNYRK